jgi:2-polyprenyl-3-methyl-5-hydroxy-6-metoxy-1,4-benzoquinol methylase
MAYPERIVPDETPPGPVAIHEKRYRFALPHCTGKRVLDGACGVGYGSAVLADAAAEVVGVDVSEDAIAYARSRYGRANVEFRVDDLLAPHLDDGSFDVVCSFETIEHLPDRDAYLGHVVRVLRDGGVFIVSTPRVDETTESPENPYHCVEYSRPDFAALLARYFGRVVLYGERRLQTRRHRALQRLDVLGLRRRVGLVRSLGRLTTGTEPTQSVSLEGLVIEPGDVDTADVIVAVCTEPRRT